MNIFSLIDSKNKNINALFDKEKITIFFND